MTLQAHRKLLRLSSGSRTAWIQEVPLSSIFNYVLITIYNRQCVIYGNYRFWRPLLKISDKETDKTWKWAKLTWPVCCTKLTLWGEKGMPDKAVKEILYRVVNACWQLNQAEEEHNCCGCIPLFVNAYIQYHNNWILCKGVIGTQTVILGKRPVKKWLYYKVIQAHLFYTYLSAANKIWGCFPPQDKHVIIKKN